MKQALLVILSVILINSVRAQEIEYTSPLPKFTPYQSSTLNDSCQDFNFEVSELGLDQPARWLSVDPMADKYPGWSPYNYTFCNPLTFIDPNGADVSDFYDRDGDHKHIDDNDENAYLVSSKQMNNIDSKTAKGIKNDENTFNLGSNKDLVALSNLIYNEARGESNSTQIAIAFTVMNRSDISGRSIAGEVYRPSQFSGMQRWANLTLDNATSKQKNALVNCYNSAFDAAIMNANSNNPIGNNVTHFYSPSSQHPYPWWGDPGKQVELPSPYNSGNFIYWENLSPYIRK